MPGAPPPGRAWPACLLLCLLSACGGERSPATESHAPEPPPASAAEGDVRIPEPPRVGMLCPDPALPCPGFRPHDLSFVLSREEVARDEQRSDSFFAVILRSGPACSIAEEERRRTQEDFPGRKVFAHRFGCDDDVENNVTYTGVDQGLAFLAVYAGENRPAGDSALAAAGRYAGANLRRMQVVYVYP